MSDPHSLLSAFITSMDTEGNTARINTDAIYRIESLCPADSYADSIKKGRNIVLIKSNLGLDSISWGASTPPDDIFNQIQEAQIERLGLLKQINIALPSLEKSFNSFAACTNARGHALYIQSSGILRIDNEIPSKLADSAQSRLKCSKGDSIFCIESIEEIEEAIKQAELRRIKALSQHNLLIR
jgi:hypothetical protein